ncbi:uncharacterized protein LOC115921286 [Strongylocentrotus purpuratus]|uniref:Death domain-containing protein n=1 Tax=Strongylocentrotus purpuratus TaxID=7668 RepID=A0A7M7NC22_STRPU|nr:uncharacterized protein LOC115921286 [Strongylocentrotus purpuratus]
MSRNSNEDFDDILMKIAKQIYGKVVVDALGKDLGFMPADTARYNDENAQQGGSYMGTLNMLRKWRQGQKKAKQREILKAALEKNGFEEMAEEYLSADDVGQDTKHTTAALAGQGASSRYQERSTNREVTKKEIVKLSKLLPDGKYSELCGILGFEYNYIKKIKKNNFMDSTAAFEELLHEWKDKAGSIEDLDAALKEAELGGLVSAYKN